MSPMPRVLIPQGLSSMRDALLVSATDPAGSLYFGPHVLHEGDVTIGQFFGFRAFPIPGGAMVLPLRCLPRAPGVLQFVGGVQLDPTEPPTLWRQDMVFGLPCWAPRIVRPARCLVETMLPGPMFPPGRQIDFDSRMEVPFLIPGGWTDQADGRWTLGYHSSLQFRVPSLPPVGAGVVIEVEGAGFIPRGSGYLVVDVAANGSRIAQWRISTTEEVALRASIPKSLIPSDRSVRLTLSALNARRPIDSIAGATDRRLLGFRVRAVPAAAVVGGGLARLLREEEGQGLCPWTPLGPRAPGPISLRTSSVKGRPPYELGSKGRRPLAGPGQRPGLLFKWDNPGELPGGLFNGLRSWQEADARRAAAWRARGSRSS